MSETRAAPAGVMLVVNGDYGRSLVEAAEVLVGELGIGLIMVCTQDLRPDLEARIERAVAQLDRGGGVLMLTDLCGSTPANICLAQTSARPGRAMVAGVNLPMLLKLSTCDRTRGASELAEELAGTGRRSVVTDAALKRDGGSCGD